jgi:hypothetical protein
MRRDAICSGLVQSLDQKGLRLISYKEKDGHVMEGVLQEHVGKNSCRKISSLIEMIKKR